MAVGTLSFSAAFARSGKGEIQGTIFKGAQTSSYHSVKNTRPRRGMAKPMACISYSMGKAIASLPDVLGFGLIETPQGQRYYMEIARTTGVMPIEYDPQTRTFYHTCQANGGICYHLFELVAAMIMADEPQGELASHFQKLDHSRTIDDEENFFIACDAMYFDGKEKYDDADIELFDDTLHRVVVTDRTSDIFPSKTGQFTCPTNVASSAQTSSAPVAGQTGSLELDFGRPFTPEEEALIEANAKLVGHVQLSERELLIARQMSTGKVVKTMMIGDSGTGKTVSARAIAHVLQAPVYSQNLSLNAEESTLLGRFIPDPTNPGGFTWVDGEYTKAFRDGGVFIAEEMNYAKPGVLGVLNNTLDGTGILVLDNGEVIRRHPNFRFFSLMNIGYAGTQRMNVALINRMNKVVKFADMDKAKMIQIAMHESGYTNRAVLDKMADCVIAIKDKIRNEQIDGAEISVRNMVSWAVDVVDTKDPLESSWATVIWPAFMDDEDLQKQVFEDIIKARLQGVRA